MKILIIIIFYFCITSFLQYWLDDKRILNKFIKDIRKGILDSVKENPLPYTDEGFRRIKSIINAQMKNIPDEYLANDYSSYKPLIDVDITIKLED